MLSEKLIKKWNKKAYEKFINAFSGSPLSEKHSLLNRINARVHGNSSYFCPRTITHPELFCVDVLDKRMKLHNLAIQRIAMLLEKTKASNFYANYNVYQAASKHANGRNTFSPLVALFKIMLVDDNGMILNPCPNNRKVKFLYLTITYEVSK